MTIALNKTTLPNIEEAKAAIKKAFLIEMNSLKNKETMIAYYESVLEKINNGNAYTSGSYIDVKTVDSYEPVFNNEEKTITVSLRLLLTLDDSSYEDNANLHISFNMDITVTNLTLSHIENIHQITTLLITLAINGPHTPVSIINRLSLLLY